MIIVFLLLVGAIVRSAWGLNLLNESCDGHAEVQLEALGLESVTLCMQLQGFRLIKFWIELKFERSLVHLQEPMVRSNRLPGLQSYSML